VRRATDWIMARAADPVAVLAGATPYLRMMSVLVAGGYMLDAAMVAADDASLDAGFREARVATARFFGEQIVPQVLGLEAAVTSDPAGVMSFDAERLRA